MAATAFGDWAAKVGVRFIDPAAVQLHEKNPSGASALILLSVVLATIAVVLTCDLPRWWVTGSGVAYGGGLANMIELELRGSATNFIRVGDWVANPADAAIVLGAAVAWGGPAILLVVALARKAIPARVR